MRVVSTDPFLLWKAGGQDDFTSSKIALNSRQMTAPSTASSKPLNDSSSRRLQPAASHSEHVVPTLTHPQTLGTESSSDPPQTSLILHRSMSKEAVDERLTEVTWKAPKDMTYTLLEPKSTLLECKSKQQRRCST